ncbi:MAG: DUF2723 domain-containing protein [Acidobacteriota bacterium]
MLPAFQGTPEPWRTHALPCALLAAFTAAIYVSGASRTIYVGDSGELVAAAATLGIPHPSGYPLYVLLGHLWISLVPAGSVAFRMSLMSAFFGALAVAGLYLLCRRLALSVPASLFGALLLAFMPSFWSQATVQRVYTLNVFFAVLVTLLALEWLRSRRIAWMVGAALCAGLGASNHTVIGVYGVAVGVVALLAEPALLSRRRWHHLAACVGAGLLGLLPYAYLPLRSRQQPRLDWGNPETLDAFLGVLLRRDFWDRAWNEKPSDWLIILGDFAKSLGAETLWIGLALAGVGAVLGWRRGFPVPLALAGMAANVWAMGAHGSRSDLFIWHRYYLLSYMLLALLAACGVHLLVERLGARRGWRPAAAVLLVPLALMLLGWREHDRSRYRLAEDFSRTLLETLPPGASLAASDDNILFVLIYLHLVEGMRPDIHLIMQGVGGADLPSLRFDPEENPLYFTHHPNWNHPQIDVVPVGLAFRTVRRGAGPEAVEIPERLSERRLDGEDDPRVPRDYLTQNLVGHFHYMLGITYERSDWPVAARAFEKAAESAPSNDVLFYNLGLIYHRNGLVRRAVASFERSRAVNPRRLASNKPARASDRLREMGEELSKKETLEAELGSTAALAGASRSAAWHRSLAGLLEARGEARWARGHRLLAEEAVQREDTPPNQASGDAR